MSPVYYVTYVAGLYQAGRPQLAVGTLNVFNQLDC